MTAGDNARSAVDGCEIGFCRPRIIARPDEKFFPTARREGTRPGSRSRAFTKLPYTYETIPSPRVRREKGPRKSVRRNLSESIANIFLNLIKQYELRSRRYLD
ncbi:hypothetical protein PUN28_011669 [Cardiocondyla obscurior]|uniref:Uncharacterized protein n=1 Tax=Cardiocondyla obscurior TaxID=286306 RepID=A0AAW2FK42_9HYME